MLADFEIDNDGVPATTTPPITEVVAVAVTAAVWVLDSDAVLAIELVPARSSGMLTVTLVEPEAPAAIELKFQVTVPLAETDGVVVLSAAGVALADTKVDPAGKGSVSTAVVAAVDPLVLA